MAAASSGSFRTAATRLSLSPSAVSRHIALLEGHLGTALFERAATASKLTGTGRRYLASIEPAMTTIRDRTSDLAARNGPGDLTMAVSCSLMANWLMARLPNLSSEHQFGVRLIFTRDTDVVLNGRADVAIWREFDAMPEVATELLFEMEGVPAAAAHLLDDEQALTTAKLVDTSDSGGLWHRWLRPPEHVLRSSGMTVFDTSQTVYEAAAAGLGVAIAVPLLADAHLISERLLPCGEARPLSDRYLLCSHPAGARRRRDLRQFRDWIELEVKQSLDRFAECCLIRGRCQLMGRLAA